MTLHKSARRGHLGRWRTQVRPVLEVLEDRLLLADGISASGHQLTGTVGVALSNVAVATFVVTDSSGSPGTMWNSMINWGDNSSPDKRVVASAQSGGSFAFLDSHTYAQTGTFTITVMIAVPGSHLPNDNTVTSSAVVTSATTTLKSIAVTPANQSLVKGQTLQFAATGTFSDNSTQDITSQVTWVSGTTSVATINSAGLATGVNSGTSLISASFHGVTGSTNLTVPATQLAISNLSSTSITAGGTVSFTVTAEDNNSNPVPSYTGTVRLSSSDINAMYNGAPLPANYTFVAGDNGAHTFTVTLRTAGSSAIRVTDQSNIRLTALTSSITVAAGTFSKFALSVQGGNTVVAGNAFLLTAQAMDAFGNIVTSYSGPANITASASPPDPQVNYSINAPVNSNGFAIFLGTLQTAGSYTLTAAGASTNVTVTPASPNYFMVTAPASAITGSAFNVTVKVFDRFGNPATGYTGTVSLTSTDPAASALAPNYTFVAANNGVHTFSVTLNSSTLASGLGATIIVRDVNATTPPITGFSPAIAVQGLVVLPGAAGFMPRPDGFTVTFSKPFMPADLTMYGLNLTTVQDVTLVGANNGNPTTINGSIYLDPSNLSQMTFKASTEFLLEDNPDAVAALPDDTYTVTLVSGTGSNGFVDALNTHLDGLSNGTAANWTTTFTTTYQDDAHGGAGSTPILAIPDFARGPDSSTTVTVPNNKTAPGIPVTLYNAKASVTDATFTLVYNPNIYTPTGGGTGDAPAGSTFTMGTIATIDSNHSVVTFIFHSDSGHTGTIVLGDILGIVPNSAAGIYKTKGLLNPTAITITGGAAVQPSAGLDVDAYLGDVHVTAAPTIDISDAVDAQKVSSGAATGFTSYTLLDPAIVGGFIAQHTISVDTSDVTNLFARAAHGAVPQLPNIPAAVTTVSVGGADPTVSLGDAIRAANGIVSVPVLLDDPHPVGSTGMTEAHLALTYDPSLLSVAPSDITLGSIPGLGAGWQITSEVDAATGQIGINLFNLTRTPITATQAGSLVNIAFHIAPGATVPWAAVQLVSQVTPSGQRILTEVDDDQGPLTLSPGVDQVVLETGAPGLPTTSSPWPELRHSEAPGASVISRAGALEYLSPGHEFEGRAVDDPTEASLPGGSEINVALAFFSNGAVAGQVFQIGTAPTLNSLLHGDRPGQLAADRVFLALAFETDALAEFNSPSLSPDNQQPVSDRSAAADKVFAQLADEGEDFSDQGDYQWLMEQ